MTNKNPNPNPFYNYQKTPNPTQLQMNYFPETFNSSQPLTLRAIPSPQGQKYQNSLLQQANHPIMQSILHKSKSETALNKPIIQNGNLNLEELRMPRNQAFPVTIPPQRRVEYVPYEQRYVEYVKQRVRVPVQKQVTDYYKIEHIIDYIPIEKQEIVYVTQPKEIVDMKLQYVPVQQRIVHVKEEDAKFIQNNQQNLHQQYSQYEHMPVTFQQPPKANNLAFEEPNQSYINKAKTNYVTSEDYDPNKTLKQIDRVLASSTVREVTAKHQYYNPSSYGWQDYNHFYGPR